MYASLASLWWCLIILPGKVSGIEKKFFHIVGRPCQMANALLLQMHLNQLLYTQPHIRTNCSNKHNGTTTEREDMVLVISSATHLQLLIKLRTV